MSAYRESKERTDRLIRLLLTDKVRPSAINPHSVSLFATQHGSELTQVENQRIVDSYHNAECNYRAEKIIRGMIAVLDSAGWKPYRVDNGGDEYETTPDPDSMVEHGFATGEAQLYFRQVVDGTGQVCSVIIAPGNGSDVICDSSNFGTFGEVIEAYENTIPDET